MDIVAIMAIIQMVMEILQNCEETRALRVMRNRVLVVYFARPLLKKAGSTDIVGDLRTLLDAVALLTDDDLKAMLSEAKSANS